MKNVRLLFDFGHGIDTPGKRSPDGRLREYKYAREVGSKVAEYFIITGHPTYIVVPEEKDISLPERVRRVNAVVAKYPSDQCLLISFHVNAAANGTWANARGWQVHVSKNASYNSKVLANNLFDAAKELGVNTRVPLVNQKYWENNFYILSHTKCPAVLTENFFQDNREDVDFLLSDIGRATVANIHIIGLSKYLGLPYSMIVG